MKRKSNPYHNSNLLLLFRLTASQPHFAIKRILNHLLLCSLLLMLCHCSLEKRHYRHGYYVKSPFSNKSITKSSVGKSPEEKRASSENRTLQTNPPAWPDLKATLPWASTGTNALLHAKQPDAEMCDSLFLKDGTVIEVKIKEIGTKDIRYKLCDFQDGPDYLVEKFRVASVRYSNGMLERFNEPPPPVVSKKPTPGNSSIPKGEEKNSNAANALTWGILGIYPLWIFGSIVGLIFGLIAMNQIKMNPGRYNNEISAKVGLGLSIGALVLWFFLIFIALMI